MAGGVNAQRNVESLVHGLTLWLLGGLGFHIFRVDVAFGGFHGEVHATLFVDFDDFHLYFVSNIDDVRYFLYAPRSEFGDMDESIFTREHLDKSAELHESDHLSFK